LYFLAAYIVPPSSMDDSVHPSSMDDSVHPSSMDDSVHPSSMEDSVHPSSMDDSDHPKVHKIQANRPAVKKRKNSSSMHDTVPHSIIKNTWSLRAECMRQYNFLIHSSANILCMLALALCIRCNGECMNQCTCNLHACHYVSMSPMYPEMKFLNINLTKWSSLLLRAFHSSSNVLKKTILYSGFKNPYKKSAKQEKGKMRAENQTKT
jgi:hypothetical protein